MERTSLILKALSEETRLRIMNLVIDGEICVCDIMTVLNMPQSTVSRHIAYLKNAGLVRGRRQGTWMHYSIIENDITNDRGNEGYRGSENDFARDEILKCLRVLMLKDPVAIEDLKRLNKFRREKNKCE
ncbi:MAG: winged helix-turn-helix transcriptional regulator [Candidatus Schekmanbacteria bacterium]|nr:winged helix-turn-helix transcriptional regulator [Candidatus Schekmanbacteria bacterium]